MVWKIKNEITLQTWRKLIVNCKEVNDIQQNP